MSFSCSTQKDLQFKELQATHVFRTFLFFCRHLHKPERRRFSSQLTVCHLVHSQNFWHRPKWVSQELVVKQHRSSCLGWIRVWESEVPHETARCCMNFTVAQMLLDYQFPSCHFNKRRKAEMQSTKCSLVQWSMQRPNLQLPVHWCVIAREDNIMRYDIVSDYRIWV